MSLDHMDIWTMTCTYLDDYSFMVRRKSVLTTFLSILQVVYSVLNSSKESLD